MKLKFKLLETYQRKMQFERFKSQMHMYLNSEKIHGSILPEIETKLKNLEEHKKKSNQKKGGNKK